MPVYEYACVCGERFEEMRTVEKRDEPIECPKHTTPGEHRTIRVVSLTSFALTGGGWAKDGYGG